MTTKKLETTAHENNIALRSRFEGIFNFLFDDVYPEEQKRSAFRYSRKIKIKNYSNIQARYMRLKAVCGTLTRKKQISYSKYGIIKEYLI